MDAGKGYLWARLPDPGGNSEYLFSHRDSLRDLAPQWRGRRQDGFSRTYELRRALIDWPRSGGVFLFQWSNARPGFVDREPTLRDAVVTAFGIFGDAAAGAREG
jgi:hypothetical protein